VSSVFWFKAGRDGIAHDLFSRRQPIPVAIARKDLKAELERAVASTYLQVGTGTSLCAV
jgi:hypothetical protein